MRIILARHLFCKTRLIEVDLAMQPKLGRGSEHTMTLPRALSSDWGHAETAAHSIRWREVDMARHPKGHRIKVKIAQQLRAQTPMSR
jgi:hypothetical protein